MSVDTNNYYGKISISDDAIAAVAGFATLDSYGVVDVVSKNISSSLRELIVKQPYSRGIRISNIENRIFIDIYCILKYGISVSAIAESLKKTVKYTSKKKSIKYSVEDFTGMIVDTVNVHVVGVRV